MANLQQAGFASMSDLDAQQKKIDRARKYAELLQTQSMSPMSQGQMVGGRYIAASPLEGIGKLIQGVSSQYGMRNADQDEAALKAKSNEMLVSGLENYQKTLQGTPAQTSEIVDDEYGPQTVRAPAVAGNRQAALAELLRSGHPVLQQMGMQQALAKPESMFNKIDAKDFTPESVAKFAASNNYADLSPVRKKEVVNDQVVDLFGATPGTIIPKRGNPFADLLVSDESGALVPNAPLIQAKKDIGKASAPSVNVKTDVKMGESLANQVGPMMKDSVSAAEGAVKQVDAAQRILSALESNKIYAGPGANVRLKASQVGEMLGINGKDEAEKIANTRATIRGLAEMTLQGRQQMRGQGAITEGEGALAQKAMSGDISDLTAAEIKQLSKASERAARFNYNEHQRKLKVMQQNPNLQGVSPFYEGPGMPPEMPVTPQPATSQAPRAGAKFLGFE